MAELAKKIHMINRSGTAQTAKIYSTTAEVGNHWLFANVDGVPAYVPIGDINDGRATSGRVKGSGGDTFAILNSGKPLYAEMSWTTPGAYTFTVPAGVTRIRVAVCGGGGSGSLSVASSSNSSNALNGNSGGDSSAFGITATGGGGAKGYKVNHESPPQSYVGAAGAPNGYAGNYDTSKLFSQNKGTAGFDISFTKTSGSYGKGGAGEQPVVGYYWCGGGSGGYNSDYANVTPLQTYQIIVGAAGANYGDSAHEYPTSGFVFIAFGGDI